MKRRVVITGLGVVSPLAVDLPGTWRAMCAGQSGISTISCFDASGLPCRIAGEIREFDAAEKLGAREARKMDRFMQLGIAAGIEAIEDSNLKIDAANAPRIGVYIGSGIGGVNTIEATTALYAAKGARRVSPFYIPMTITNMVSGNLSILYGLQGPNLAMVTACSTGTHAIGDAARMIEYGDADAMVAGAAEAPISPTSVAGFSAARALSSRNDEPTHASRPWDIGRDGFVMGEGAGVMVLEEYQHARARGARIYAELNGFGMSGDAHHISAPAPGGEGAVRCMQSALKNAAIAPTQIDYINAHGTSTPIGDIAETQAIKTAFGAHASKLAVSSNKSMIGHLLGAAGGVEAVMTAMTIYHGEIPPTINLVDQDPECDLDFVADGMRKMRVRYALSNSFGFGGTNGTLVFGAVDA